MANDKIKHETIELHDYPRKPEIEYIDPSTGTYHYTIISEGYYPSPPVLVRTQRKNDNSYRIPDSYKTYNPNGKSTLPGTIVFGLQLKLTLQKDPESSKLVKNYSKDKTFEKIKSQASVRAMDSNYISREAFRSMAKIYPELAREYIISNEKLNIDKIMQDIIPLHVMDININSPTILVKSNEEIHIDSEEVIRGITESVGKASYRSIKNILKYMIPFYIEESILDLGNPLIMLRISGDGRNVGNIPERHYTIVLYPGIEDYQILQNVLMPLIHDLKDISQNGIDDEFGNKWNIQLYFSSDWKFLALCLGLNAANSIYFCPYCKCTKKEIGLYNRCWDKKNMEMLINSYNTCPGHIREPLFFMIPLENWIPDELHILLRITDHLWNLVIAEIDLNNNQIRNIICEEMKRIGISFHFWQEHHSRTWNFPSITGDKKLKLLCEFDLTKLFNQQRAILI
ncbi:33735_t:CDS:2 [Gigaspora margarita]|uniref:33735_t:CDS:1 n=1 Tax=Gigaspora margarita TaxID=4874 RepID=A0ABN7WHT0_GIGMA|nr:33735_t:CDS:2 [Gigaspora margarita]